MITYLQNVQLSLPEFIYNIAALIGQGFWDTLTSQTTFYVFTSRVKTYNLRNNHLRRKKSHHQKKPEKNLCIILMFENC